MSRSIHKLTIPTIALATILSFAPTARAERGDDSGRASKNGMTTGTVDGVDITIEYGRPKVKGREIWGGLVPYGEVWRTGADEATSITFGSDALVEGEPIAAGTYALFTVPGEDEWTVIFNSVAEQWGAYDRDAAKDVLTISVAPRRVDHVEELEFGIGEGHVGLHWETVGVAFEVAAAP